MRPLFDRVIIVGVGLIGASLGMVLVRKKLAREVIGVGRNPANLKIALRREAIHRALSPRQAKTLLSHLGNADLVILALPVQGIRRTLEKISRKCFVTDVGSTKEAIVREAERQKLRFVGGHPIAGTEKTGAINGHPHLFKNRVVILTPSKRTTRSDRALVGKLWQGAGAKVTFMEARAHDRVLAGTSHLPHVIAYSLVATVMKRLPQKDIRQLAFSSFRDATRVAASSPEMWADIFLENQEQVTLMAMSLRDELACLTDLIEGRKKARLVRFLSEARKFRLSLGEAS